MVRSKSFQQQYYLTTTKPFRRIVRNLDLLAYILGLIWTWAILGGQVRRAHEQAKKTGQPLFVDFLAKTKTVKEQRR